MVDPFDAAGVVETPSPPSRVVGGRYAIATPLYQSPRGAVHLALDVETLTNCVLKQACFGAQPAPDGSDARDRLRRESTVLRILAADERIPRVFELIEQDYDLFLAMEDVAGKTLDEEHVARATRRGASLPPAQVVDYGVQLASMLGKIHSAGYAYRALKPTDVIAAPNGQLRLVDFEMVRELNGETRIRRTSRGHSS